MVTYAVKLTIYTLFLIVEWLNLKCFIWSVYVFAKIGAQQILANIEIFLFN